MKQSGMTAVILMILLVASIAPVQAADEPVELTLWVNWWPDAAIQSIQKVCDNFAEANPRVSKVNVMIVGEPHQMEKLTLAVVSDAGVPDVVTLQAPFAQFALAGLLQPIERYLQRSERVQTDDYSPFVMNAFSSGNVVYGIPNVEAALGLVLIYSKDIFNEAGLPTDQPPTTLEEVRIAHRRTTTVNSEGTELTQLGLNPTDSMGGNYFPTIWGTVFDVSYYDEDANSLDLSGFAKAAEWIKSIYEYPSYNLISRFSGQIGGWTAGLASGKLAMQINGSWVPGELRSRGSDLNMGYTWMPSILGDKATASLPWGQGIPVNAPHPDLSWQLIEYFTTAEACQIMFDGVGWLNGNLSAMQELDVSRLPVIQDIIAMFAEADRLNAPPPLPIMNELRQAFQSSMGKVWSDTETSANVLANIQRTMQIRLEDVLSKN